MSVPNASDKRTSAEKVLAVLDVFGEGECMGVTEVGRRAQLTKSTAHRLLATLERHGLIERTGVEYSLGLGLFELGSRAGIGPHGSLARVALPYLTELYEATGQTVHLAVLDRSEVVYVCKLHGHAPQPSPTRIGGRMPAHCTALGKAVLAYSPEPLAMRVAEGGLACMTRHTILHPDVFMTELRRTREEGVSYDRQETTLGLGCVGAPILDERGRSLAAVSVSGPISRISSYSARTLKAARSIQNALAVESA
ncbi:MAG: IclR family transcriptional regulator, regulon repressor [Thermoleophilaceae bacterium]|nr:IclR family transcriptional regulator, regulon repressor [Thermoleophilaceae bacterium]MEA2401154.1 IclR family transcriptional regulator, regulon repressor [Thermoleophilaceae bacterium]